MVDDFEISGYTRKASPGNRWGRRPRWSRIWRIPKVNSAAGGQRLAVPSAKSGFMTAVAGKALYDQETTVK
jgi:hypothetical protein